MEVYFDSVESNSEWPQRGSRWLPMDPDEEVRQILARAEELLVLGKVLEALEQVWQR